MAGPPLVLTAVTLPALYVGSFATSVSPDVRTRSTVGATEAGPAVTEIELYLSVKVTTPLLSVLDHPSGTLMV